MLMCAFVIAQLLATFISVYANWEFTLVRGCGWTWAGIVWLWNLIWFLPMDLIKFGMRRLFEPANSLQENKTPLPGYAHSRRASAISATSSARYYANRTRSLRSLERPQNFGKKLLGMNKRMSTDVKEMRRFSSIQTSHAAQMLNA
ncbi:hypothetical protein BJ944DRAFT_258024 [Cunninghamella echinulata]|nr:hypothetical protein BJ944DRAFT_258024 [Cunninghamella echinulata]